MMFWICLVLFFSATVSSEATNTEPPDPKLNTNESRLVSTNPKIGPKANSTNPIESAQLKTNSTKIDDDTKPKTNSKAHSTQTHDGANPKIGPMTNFTQTDDGTMTNSKRGSKANSANPDENAPTKTNSTKTEDGTKPKTNSEENSTQFDDGVSPNGGPKVNPKTGPMANSNQTNDGNKSKTSPKANSAKPDENAQPRTNSTQTDDGANPKAAKTDNSTSTANCPVTSSSSSAALGFLGGIFTIVILEALGFAWMKWYRLRKHSRYFDFSSNMGIQTWDNISL